MSSVRAFIGLSRPHFLIGGFVMCAIGAVSAGVNSWWAFAVGQFLVSAAQLTAHYINEYADYDADLLIENRTAFSGGSGVLTSGTIQRSVALRAGQVTTAIAAGAVIVMIHWSPAAAALGVACIAVSWAYSMPPLRLLSTGLGEGATALTVALMVPLIGALAQAPRIPVELWAMVAVLVPLQLVMLLAFELPDSATDALADKRVLAVRLGPDRTFALMVLSVAVALALGLESYALNQIDGVSLAAGLGPSTALLFAMFVGIGTRNHALTTLSAVAAFFLSALGFLLTAL